jgi:predicted Zn-dependent protease
VDRLKRVSAEVVAAIQRPDIAAEYRRVYKLPRKDDKSRRVPFEYIFKVVDAPKEVNAFSLAGGPIYVTTGLLNYTVSDHELAAVLAHECSHVAFHHVEQLVRKQKKVNAAQMWGLLATVIAGAAGGGAAAAAASNLLIGGQLVSIAMTSGYGRDLETEADRIGLLALRHTQYQPLAMMTFMQKLSRDHQLHGSPDAGIFQSHPFANERVNAIRKELIAQGKAVDLGAQREVSGAFRVEAVPMVSAGREQAELRLNGQRLYLVAAGENGQSPIARAQRMAKQLEQLFHESITFNDVRLSPDKRAVWMKGVAVIQVYPEDASAGGEEVADKAYKRIMQAMWQEKLSSNE